MKAAASLFERFFMLKKNGTTIRMEIIAGVTTAPNIMT